VKDTTAYSSDDTILLVGLPNNFEGWRRGDRNSTERENSWHLDLLSRASYSTAMWPTTATVIEICNEKSSYCSIVSYTITTKNAEDFVDW